MRILRFLFKLLLIIVALFFLSGLVFPKINYSVSQQVNLPLNKTFALFNDNNKIKNWIPSLKKMEVIEEKPGVVGSKHKIIMEVQGDLVEMTELVTTFQENKRVALEMSSFEMLKKDNYTFQTKGNQTLIHNQSSIAGKTYFLRCLYASFFWLIKAEDQAMLDRFKAYAER